MFSCDVQDPPKSSSHFTYHIHRQPIRSRIPIPIHTYRQYNTPKHNTTTVNTKVDNSKIVPLVSAMPRLTTPSSILLPSHSNLNKAFLHPSKRRIHLTTHALRKELLSFPPNTTNELQCLRRTSPLSPAPQKPHRTPISRSSANLSSISAGEQCHQARLPRPARSSYRFPIQ